MHVRMGFVFTVFAAAAGAAVGRATAPPGAPALAPGVVTSTTPALGSAKGGAASRVARERSFRAGAGRVPGSQAVVYVAGAVAKPGVYALRSTARAQEALRAAGGATTQADLVAINLAARVEDGEEIAVPVRGAEASLPSGSRHSAAKHPRRHAAKRGHRPKRQQTEDAADTADAPTETVDINAADEATLETLPGVGPSLARRIVAFRDLNGPFASSDELLDVGGMTAAKVDALSPYVTFH